MIHLVGPPEYLTFLYGHKRNTTERVGKKQTNNMDLGQFQGKKGEVYVWHLHSPCICRLTLACILRETSKKCTNNADIFLRWLARPLCSSSGFSSRLSDSDILWTVHSKLTSSPLPSVRPPLCISLRQLTLSGFLCQLLFSPTSSLIRDLELRPLFSFTPKQTKRSSAWRTHP